MESSISKIGYFVIALIWNIAVASVVLFLVSWPIDILGAIVESKEIRDYAYGGGILGAISMFWFGLLAAVFSYFVKCKKCGSRTMSLSYPYFVPLLKCRCANCGKTNA